MTQKLKEAARIFFHNKYQISQRKIKSATKKKLQKLKNMLHSSESISSVSTTICMTTVLSLSSNVIPVPPQYH